MTKIKYTSYLGIISIRCSLSGKLQTTVETTGTNSIFVFDLLLSSAAVEVVA